MIKAFRRMLYFSLFAGLLMWSNSTARAQVVPNVILRVANSEPEEAPRLPDINPGEFKSLVPPAFRYVHFPAPSILPTDTATLLQNAIERRLGVRYRYNGADDRGYDCSGFVWSVFREIGADFDRTAARALWRRLPEATGVETRQFGALVFFKGLKHIGIVRDEDSFYHSSRSHGVILSRFSGYWGRRIIGYRRSPAPILPIPPDTSSKAK